MTSRTMTIRSVGILLLAALFLLVSSACQQSQAAPPPESPASVVVRYLDALQRNDYESANACLTDDASQTFAIPKPSGVEMDALYAQVMRKMEYSLVPSSSTAAIEASPTESVQIHGNDHTSICIAISSLDIPTLFDQAIETLSNAYAQSLSQADPMPEDELEEAFYLTFSRSLEQPDAPRLADRIQIHLLYHEGTWRIEADDKLYNAVTGNALEIVARLPEWEK